MKRILKLCDPTPGLAAYLRQCPDGEASWEGFRDHRNHSGVSAHHEILAALATLQHGLCGYCEIDLKELDRQVEHVIPRSDPAQGSSEALNAGNMIACCLGGSARNRFGPDAAGDDDRYRWPAKRHLSCGQKKGEDSIPVDPRMLPALPSVITVTSEGKIMADAQTCARRGFDACMVTRTIDVLGLNVERLRRAREKRWNALNRIWRKHFDDPDVMAEAARSELLPGDASLRRFFTTSRSWFGDYGERVLHQDRRWV